MEEMRTKGTGVAIPGLNSSAVRSLSILVPPVELSRRFDAAGAVFIRSLLRNCKESRTLAAIRDALLPKLISGEIRVKEEEKLVEKAD